MADTNILIILNVFLLIAVCCGIGVDYFLAEDSNSQDNSSMSHSRRSGMDIELDYSNFSNLEPDIINAFFYEKYDKSRLRKPWVSCQNETVTDNSSFISNHSYIPPGKNNTLPVVNVYQDYSYYYEDYSNDIPDDQELSIEQEKLHEVSIGRNDEEYTPHFFNLEPASDESTNLEKKNVSSNNIWYLAQNLPCWELPILFGELRRKKRNVNVFSIFKDQLHNVVVPATAKQPFRYEETVPPSGAGAVNKWCELEPCFGDHTLCLFSANIHRDSCGSNYIVNVPNILQQIAIVNTINSMRNRVANQEAARYMHLPPASNMNQILYSQDLQEMSKRWLQQCLPGSAPCSSLDGHIVKELQCTKIAKQCCFNATYKCKPRSECFVYAIIGCIHLWFWKAGHRLLERDVNCGKASVVTFPTVQLLWARTTHIGCAYAQGNNGDQRVICNFSPGAPFYITTKLYCGFLSLQNALSHTSHGNVSEHSFAKSLGLQWDSTRFVTNNTLRKSPDRTLANRTINKDFMNPKIKRLNKVYEEGLVREQFHNWQNGTISSFAVVVSEHMFIDETQSRCDSDESIYIAGKTGELCTETGRTFHGLCDDFSDRTTWHRMSAVIASILLFILVLYDLFSGIVRQNN